MLTALFFILAMVASYLFGSICSAIIVCRLFSLPDPNTEGSQNPGATNVLRLAGKKYALIVLLADMLKGFIPVMLVSMFGGGTIITSFACLAAVLGHIYPVFFNFKGGKGVATAIGTLLALHFMLGIIVIAIWLLIANFTRYASLASMISLILAPFFSVFTMRSLNAFIPLMAITFLILYKHRKNINRLMDGIEPKIVLGKKTVPAEPEAAEDVEPEAVETITDFVIEDTEKVIPEERAEKIKPSKED